MSLSERALRFSTRGSAALLAALAIAPCVYLIATNHKGFDLKDEGYYLLSAAHPHENRMDVRSSRIYTSQLFRALGWDIAAMRHAGLALVLASAGLLALGFRHWLRDGDAKGDDAGLDLAAVPLIGLGALLYYVLFLRTPSYNLLSSSALNAATGLLLIAYARSGVEARAVREGCLFASGLLVGILLFCKPTSAAAFYGLQVLAIFYFFRPPWRPIALLSTGIACWIALHFALLQDLGEWWEGLRNGTRFLVLLRSGYGWESVGNYVGGFAAATTSALASFWPAYLVLAAGAAGLRLARPGGARAIAWSRRTLVLSLLAFAACGWFFDYYRISFMGQHFAVFHLGFGVLLLLAIATSHPSLRTHTPTLLSRAISTSEWMMLAGVSMGLIPWLFIEHDSRQRGIRLLEWDPKLTIAPAIWAVLLVAWVSWTLWRAAPAAQGDKDRRRSRLAILGMLALVPLAGIFGTRNPININIMFHMSTLVCVLLLLSLTLARKLESRAVALVAMLILGVFASLQIVVGSSRQPYQIGPLRRNVVPTSIGTGESVLEVSRQRSAVIRGVREAAARHGFRPGDDVLAIYDLPGLVFAMGGRSPGAPWYPANHAGREDALRFALETVPLERLERAFILVHLWFPGAEFPDLKPFGIHFPRDYLLCGQVENIQLWKPRSRSQGDAKSGSKSP